MRWLAFLVLVPAEGAAGDEPGPRPREVPPAIGVGAKAPAPADDLGRRLRDLGYASLPIDRLRGGYVTVRAEAGGRPLRLLLDTGSPFSALDRDRTAPLKLDWVEPPGAARGLHAQWDFDTRCEVPAIEVGGARAEGVTVCRMIAAETNRGLAAIGDPPVDGLLGGDVLAAIGALIDYGGGRLYVRPGPAPVRPRSPGVIEFVGRDVRLPLDPDAKPVGSAGADAVQVWASADRGKTWVRAGQYRPADREVRYAAPGDGEYWLALQVAGADGAARPAGAGGRIPWRKVRVDAARLAVPPDRPPADLREEAAALRREVERLRERVRDLETGKR